MTVIICKGVGDDKETRVEEKRYSDIGRIYFDPKTNQQYDKITELKNIYYDIVENHLSKVTPRGIMAMFGEKDEDIMLPLHIARFALYAYMDKLKAELKELGYEIKIGGKK